MTEIIINWFASHEAIKVAAIEKAVGIPSGVLAKSLKCERDLPAEYVDPLKEELKRYGFVENWLD